MYRVAAYSTAGVRKNNQDSCLAEVARAACGDVALLAMCDGVGGLSDGEVASASVVHWFSEWFEQVLPASMGEKALSSDELFDIVQSDWELGIRSLNNTLHDYGDDAGTRLGTTCTAVLLYDGAYLIAHVGDSRAYRIASGSLQQLTEDQSWVAREVARGNMTAEEARVHPRKNLILQSIGTQGEVKSAFIRGETGIGDVYLVCCDGFANELVEDDLIEALGDLPADATEQVLYDAAQDLAKLALSRDEHDNISAVLCLVDQGRDYGEAVASVPDPALTPIDVISRDSGEDTSGLADKAGEVAQDG